MSFMGSKSEARAIISEIEVSHTHGADNTSPIKSGAGGPGGATAGTKPAGGVLEQKRTTLHRRTSELTRKYGAS